MNTNERPAAWDIALDYDGSEDDSTDMGMRYQRIARRNSREAVTFPTACGHCGKVLHNASKAARHIANNHRPVHHGYGRVTY